jgi:DNA-binding transcriptional MocR family regulator
MIRWDTFRVEGPGPKYLSICSALAGAIERGELRPGRRLPSHRMMAQRLGVAVGTVTRAYAEALDRGLIVGEIGRGSYVREHPPLKLSVVDSSRIPAGTLDLYQNFPVPIPEVENRAWSDALSELRRQGNIAAIVRSSWSELSARHQHAGAMWIRRTGLQASPRQVVDCPGVQSAMCAILAATTKPGDVVLAPALSHPGIKLLAEQFSLKTHGLPTDDEGIVPAALEEACRDTHPTLLYCSPTLHTPTTVTMPERRRRAIAAIAERHDLLIAEDESAAFLMPEPLLPLAALVPERAFFIGDVWLALSLGLRTTYVHTPTTLMDRMATAVASTSGLTTPLVAEIAAMWIESGTAERLIEARRAELEARHALSRKILHRRRVRSHPHAHHLWLELPERWNSELFVLRAEQMGVAVNDAEWFSIGHAPIPRAVRVCTGNAPGRDELEWALSTLDRLIDETRSMPHAAT